MKSAALLSSIFGASLALIAATTSSAQIVSGSSKGAFHDPLPPEATSGFDPAPPGTFAGISTFMTGQNENGAPGFTGARFIATIGGFNNVNLGITPTVKLGDFSWFNTVTAGTTAANSVTFDLKLSFTAPGLQEIVYSPFNVTFDGGGNPANDNLFTISAPAAGTISFGGVTYGYSFSFDTSSVILAEPGLTSNQASTASTGLYVTFTAVPEPSTYALGGVAALGLMIAARRFRRSSR